MINKFKLNERTYLILLAVVVWLLGGLGINYVVNYQNILPVGGVEHTDTTFLTTLIIDF
jgi:hypothetical protein